VPPRSADAHSSLAYLQEFPLDELKIDRSFVSSLDNGDATVVRAIAAMGHAPGLLVVAEGIEDLSQLVAVLTLGCEVGQGFTFSKAGAPDDVARAIDSGDGSLIPETVNEMARVRRPTP
jgi:diguanylate cyclase